MSVAFVRVSKWLLFDKLMQHSVYRGLALMDMYKVPFIVQRKKTSGFWAGIDVEHAYTGRGIGLSEILENFKILTVEPGEATLGRKPHVPQFVAGDGVNAILGQAVFIGVMFDAKLL